MAAVPAGKIETDGGSTAIIGVAYDPAPPSTSRRTEAPGMARATSAVPIHQVVLSNLCDLQARLRGEPATLVLARGPVHIEDGTAANRVAPPTAYDDAAIATWLDIYEMSAGRRAAASGQDAIDLTSDRREALRAVPVPCRMIAFSDDLMCPPHLCAEVAEVIPDCDYVEISSCGHLGYLERPEEVNSAIIEFLHKN